MKALWLYLKACLGLVLHNCYYHIIVWKNWSWFSGDFTLWATPTMNHYCGSWFILAIFTQSTGWEWLLSLWQYDSIFFVVTQVKDEIKAIRIQLLVKSLKSPRNRRECYQILLTLFCSLLWLQWGIMLLWICTIVPQRNNNSPEFSECSMFSTHSAHTGWPLYISKSDRVC